GVSGVLLDANGTSDGGDTAPDLPRDVAMMDGLTVDTRVDGNDAGSCAAGACRRVFVTSATTNGGFGGLDMGDLFCQSLADAGGLGGAFKAWLSDRATDAAARLSHATVPYRLVDGTLVANDWNDLI